MQSRAFITRGLALVGLVAIVVVGVALYLNYQDLRRLRSWNESMRVSAASNIKDSWTLAASYLRLARASLATETLEDARLNLWLAHSSLETGGTHRFYYFSTIPGVIDNSPRSTEGAGNIPVGAKFSLVFNLYKLQLLDILEEWEKKGSSSADDLRRIGAMESDFQLWVDTFPDEVLEKGDLRELEGCIQQFLDKVQTDSVRTGTIGGS